MSTTSDMTARMLFTGARILADYPDGLPFRRLWPLVLDGLPGLEQEWDTVRNGTTTAETNFSYYSTRLVKAGWIHKTGRRWHLTGIGRNALEDWPEAQRFFQAVSSRYSYWERNKKPFEMARGLVEAIPEGAWVAVPDLAQETELEGEALAGWLQGERPDGWHHVLRRDGGPLLFGPAIETDAESWLTLLNEDGLLTPDGRADESRRMPAGDLRQLVKATLDELETPSARAWLVRGSSVQGTNLITTIWLRQGVCSLPASQLRDLPAGTTLDEVREAIEADYTNAGRQDRARLAAEYHAFLSRMQEGDLAVTNDGSEYYVGVISGPPHFVSSVEGRANLQRAVEWRRGADKPVDYDELPDQFFARVNNPDADLIDVTEFLADLQQFIGVDHSTVVSREMRLHDVSDALAEKLLVGTDWLRECVELLRDRPQLIFYGPPGTGKTYLARELAAHLVSGRRENVQLVQFHPSYSYEDFFEGYRPGKPDGGVTFDIVWGPFRRLAKAADDHPDQPYVLIIDEINRGNLAKIFGELYFLLEYRDEAVNLLYGSDEGQGFSLPHNVIILGTMNTADRSIALVDAAMRRRFWFVELHPDEPPASEMLGQWLRSKEQPDELARLLAELNSRIDDRDFRIGPAYLMRSSALTEQGLRRIWRTQILPLLEEHHYGEGIDVRQRYGLDVLRARLQ